MKEFLVFFGLLLLVVIAVGIARLVSGPAEENAHKTERTQSASVVSPPALLPCGSGLAAQDLAGACRAKPNPTPGALEAVDERNPIKMTIQPKPQPTK